tara:strand:- start:9121 stop:13044 length:3924 start_codon:yes stop_codon:yes gene_type:complete
MSVATLSSFQTRLRHYVFGPLLVFICGLVVVAALAQGVGRTLLFFASEFTPQLNSLLASKRIRLQGVQTRWNGFNPVIRVQQVSFGAGHFKSVDMELDALESLIRSAWVPRHLYWQQAEVHFEQKSSGWQLRDQQRIELPFDVLKSIWHGDRLFGAIALIFHPSTGDAMRFSADLRAQNFSHEHLLDIVLATEDRENGELGLSWVERVGWSDKRVLARDVSVSGRLVLPPGLAGSAGIVIDSEGSRWRQRSDAGHGRLGLKATISAADLMGPVPPLQAIFEADFATRGDDIDGISRVFRVQSGNERVTALELKPLYVQMSTSDDQTWPEFVVWSQGLDLGALSRVLQPSARIWPLFAEWLSALRPTGQVHSMYGYVNAEGAGYSASLSDVSAQGYRGSPGLLNAQGRLWGGGPNIAMQLNSDDIVLWFPNLFARAWEFDYLQGLLKFHLQPGHLGLRGQNIKARRHGSAIAGQFAVTRPQNPYAQRLSIQIGMDEAEVSAVEDYISFKMSDGLQNWLREAPKAGRFSGIYGAYHGQVRQRTGELARRFEIQGELARGRVLYEPNWPELRDVFGDIHVAGSRTEVRVATAQMAGARLRDSRLNLGAGARVADIQFDAETEASQLLDFVRNTPLRSTFGFVKDDWLGQGRVSLQGAMTIPLAANAERALAVDMDFVLEQMSLSMPDYRLEIDDLGGRGAFTLPHQLAGNFVGRVFEQETAIVVTNDDQQINFSVRGGFAPEDVYTLAGVADLGVLAGASEFDANLSIHMQGGVSALAVDTDLQGMAVNLPSELGKRPSARSPSRFDLQFLDNYQSLRWRYQNTQGWVHLDDRVLRGSVGLGVAPAVIPADQDRVSIGGKLARIDVAAWSEVAAGSNQFAVDWQIDSLRADELVVGELLFTDLVLAGRRGVGEFIFSVDADDLVGRVDLSDDMRLGVDLDFLRLPKPDYSSSDSEFSAADSAVALIERDPMSVELGRSLPAAWVSIEQLLIGDDNYGNWQFEIQPEQDGVRFASLDMDVRGVRLRSSEFFWDLAEDRTAFAGRVELDDLARTLPLWDFAPTMETGEATLQVDLQWPGSPPNIELLGLHGSMKFKAKNGRFLDADTSANGLRLISLFTPSAIASRINKFDFSDIVDDGMSFDRLSAAVQVGREEMVFTERMVVESPSSSFELGGRVNLRSEMLDNEMIVTLPVSSSLPWYGAYLALANPVAGLGVVLGEQILRKPIQQFSSAKYAITGTLTDPQVKFVSLWDKSMKAVPQPGSLAPLSEASEQTPVSEIETGDVSIGPGLMTEAPAETRPRVIVEQEQSND